jgi:hypothetical protein
LALHPPPGPCVAAQTRESLLIETAPVVAAPPSATQDPGVAVGAAAAQPPSAPTVTPPSSAAHASLAPKAPASPTHAARPPQLTVPAPHAAFCAAHVQAEHVAGAKSAPSNVSVCAG